MKRIVFIVLFLLSTSSAQARIGVGAGAYVPFGFSSMGDTDGGSDIFAAQPLFYANTLIPAFYAHLFMPEIGFVKHFGLDDEYSKSTFYLMADLGYEFYPSFLFKYGYGLFFTRISGDGQELTRNNGSSTSTFYAPSKSVTTYNSTLNLGVEWAATAEFAVRFQTYIFEVLSSDKRDLSYSLSLTYFIY